MAGIQIEQIDLDSIRKVFPDKVRVKELFDKCEEDIAHYTSREVLIEETLSSLNRSEFASIGIEGRLDDFMNKSDEVTPIDETIDVTESDGQEYHITPSRGYIMKDANDVITYQHPLTHNANEILPTTDRQFASANEKSIWNNKIDTDSANTIFESMVQALKEQYDVTLSGYERRIGAIEEKIEIDTLESNRRNLVDKMNLTLSAICYKATIEGNNVIKDFNIAHNLHSTDVQVSIIDNSDYTIQYPVIDVVSGDNIVVHFNEPVPAPKSYNVIITARKPFDTIYSEINDLTNYIVSKHIIKGNGGSSESVTKLSDTRYRIHHGFNIKDDYETGEVKKAIFVSCLYGNSSAAVGIAYPDVYFIEDPADPQGNKYMNNIEVEFKNPLMEGDTFYVYISATPEILNVHGNEVIDSLINESRTTGYSNINYVLGRLIKSYTVPLRSMETDYIVPHNLNTYDIQVGIYDIESRLYSIFPDYKILDENRISVSFNPEERSRTFKVLIMSSERIVYKPLTETETPVRGITTEPEKTLYGIYSDSASKLVKDTSRKQIWHFVDPEDATNRSVTWSSSDESVATVSNTGIVTAISENGTAIITVSTNELHPISEIDPTLVPYTAQCRIITKPAIIPVESITMDLENITFISKIQRDVTNPITVYPLDATYPEYEVFSEDPSVATVNSDGTIHAVANGTTRIVARTFAVYDDGTLVSPSVSVYCNVNVNIQYVPVYPIPNPDHSQPDGITDLSTEITLWRDRTQSEKEYTDDFVINPYYADNKNIIIRVENPRVVNVINGIDDIGSYYIKYTAGNAGFSRVWVRPAEYPEDTNEITVNVTVRQDED